MSPRNGKIPPEVGIDRGAGSIAKASRSYEAGGLSINEITAGESRSALGGVYFLAAVIVPALRPCACLRE